MGDAVRVEPGITSVSGRPIPPGAYVVDRVFHGGEIGISEGSIVRPSSLKPAQEG
jgi:hypothetical protein